MKKKKILFFLSLFFSKNIFLADRVVTNQEEKIKNEQTIEALTLDILHFDLEEKVLTFFKSIENVESLVQTFHDKNYIDDSILEYLELLVSIIEKEDTRAAQYFSFSPGIYRKHRPVQEAWNKKSNESKVKLKNVNPYFNFLD